MPEAGQIFGEQKKMTFKVPESGLATNAYGERFKDVFDETSRNKQIKKSGTELYQKAKNVRLLDGAEAEYNKIQAQKAKNLCKKKGFPGFKGEEDAFKYACILMNEDDQKQNLGIWQNYMGDQEGRYAALNSLLSEFVNQAYDFDFSTDAAFVKESIRFIHVSKKADAIIQLMTMNPDYWNNTDEATRALVTKKIYETNLLWDYYKKREALIKDPIYSTRMDSELSYINMDDQDASRTMANSLTIQRMTDAEEALERLKYMDDEHAKEKVSEAMNNKFVDQQNLYTNKFAAPIGKKVKGTSRPFEWIDIFGLPLHFASFFMRDKRTKDHGRKRYREMNAMYRKLYPRKLENIGKGSHSFIRRFDKKNGAAPPIDLNPLFTDPLKLEISDLLKSNDGLWMPGTNTADDKKSAEIYEKFVIAAERYASMGGVVNADTTEMEMAFLDRMKEVQEELTAAFPNADNLPEVVRERVNMVDLIMTRIKELRSGNLKNVANKADYESAVRQSQAIIQDTTITDNLDESNIKDIPLFTHQPNINDVKQSTIGDCYLVGAMTSFVKASPQGVLDMFQDLGDGNVMVRLFEGYDPNGNRLSTNQAWLSTQNITMKPLYVKLRKHYETGDGNANDCVWPQLLEKAYAACGFNMKGSAYVDEKGYLHNMERELTVGMGMIAASHLTGTFRRKIGINPDVTDSENQRVKEEFGDAVSSPQFIHEVCAGIPNFIVERMTDSMTTSVFDTLDMTALTNNLEMAIRLVVAEYGSMFLQIKKNFIRNGLGADEYGPVIKKMAAYLDLPLSDDWDKEGNYLARVWNGADEMVEYDIDINDQRWDIMFKQDYGKTYVDKLKENYKNIINGRPVTYHPKGLDSDVFSDKVVRKLIIGLTNRGKWDMPQKSDKEKKPKIDIEKQPKITKKDSEEMQKEITAILGLEESEMLRNEVINNHANAVRSFWANEKNASRMRKLVTRMQLEVHHNIRENMMDFMLTLQETLNKGGSLEISIGHFISAVGMRYYGGNWYILIKDPFNVYNMSYEKNGKNDTKYNEGFLDVVNLDGHHRKRHLDEKGREGVNVFGAFRGLSYWKLEDLYAMMKDYTVVLPQDVKKN